MASDDGKAPTLSTGLPILLPFLLYPAIDFVFRIATGLIAPDLSREFTLSAAELGLVSSVFFFAFGLAQLPLGVAFDRFGPRPIALGLFAVAIFGAILIVSADGMAGLIAGRILLGIGMSASLIAGIKTASLWLPDRMPLATSLLVGATGIGGMMATVPFAALLGHVDWRIGFLGLAGSIGLLFFLTLLQVPSVERHQSPGILAQFRSFGTVFGSMGLWRFAPIAMMGIGVGSAYQTLWAPLWLRDVAGYPAETVAWVMFALLGSYAAGNFAFGWLAQWRQRRGLSRMPPVLTAVILLIGCQTLLALEFVSAAMPLWIASAFLLSGAYAIYPIVTGNFPAEFAARASTALNFLVLAAVFAIQSVLGLIIDSFPPSASGHFGTDAHQWALSTAIALQALCLAWYGLSIRRRRRLG